MSQRELFGGAFSITLPADAQDVSVIREIPDNQEVFTHPHTDQSVIIELLEAVEPQQPDDVAIRTHFEEIATANGAPNDYNILHTEELPQDELNFKQAGSCYYVLGEQHVAKFDESAKNTIHLHLGLFRLPQFDTDVLVTFNDPISISLESSSHHAVATSVQQWLTDDFKTALASLSLHDPNIFGM